MTAEYLPGTIRERIQDLVKERKITQGELAEKIGCTDSTLSRFLSGKTDKLSDENIIGIARVFEVSTDFLLGVTNVPDRKNYDVGELGLSVEAAKRLYTGKVNAVIQIIQIQIVAQIQIQLVADNLNVHGFETVVDFFNLFGGKIHFFQMRVQICSTDHAVFFALSDQSLQCRLKIFHILINRLFYSTQITIPLYLS